MPTFDHACRFELIPYHISSTFTFIMNYKMMQEKKIVKSVALKVTMLYFQG